MGRFFGRNDDDATGEEVIWQDCPGCDGRGSNTVTKTNRKGESVDTQERCGGCGGQGQVPGGNR